MTSYAVDTAALLDTAARIRRAATVAGELSDHPGRVRGRAADGGDAELRDAAEELAGCWRRGLHLLEGDARRLAGALELVAQTYAQADQEAASQLAVLDRWTRWAAR